MYLLEINLIYGLLFIKSLIFILFFLRKNIKLYGLLIKQYFNNISCFSSTFLYILILLYLLHINYFIQYALLFYNK